MHHRIDGVAQTVVWTGFADLHPHLQAPLSPTGSDVATVRGAIEGNDRQVLLLGMTPALTVLGASLTAIDNSSRLIETVWPGNGPGRRAVLGNWLYLPVAPGSVDAVVGDGSLNSIAGNLPALLSEVARVLLPRGVGVFRTFCSPEQPESLGDIVQDVEAGWIGNFHALKWRIAMSMASRTAGWTVAVAEVRKDFNDLFRDRDALSRATGWPAGEIATIDHYASAGHSLIFPPLSELLRMAALVFPSARVVPASGYPLAERCPTLVVSKHPDAAG